MPRVAPKHRPNAPMAPRHEPRIVEGQGRGWKAGKTTTERGYGWRWQKARKAFLSRPENVLCRMCQQEGRIQAATVVDHIIPHKGDERLMWDEANWQPLCKPHHDSTKQRMEARGEV